jgi:pilus assembly protein CpaF
VELKGFFSRSQKSAPPVPNAGSELASEPNRAWEYQKDDLYYTIKHKVHTRLVEELNLKAFDAVDIDDVRPQLAKMLSGLLNEEKALLNEEEFQFMVGEIVDELRGLGPIEPFLKDPTISDILINTYRHIYIERHGLLERTRSRFLDNRHLMNVLDRIVSRVGRRIDESTPMVDARLADGSRVNAIIPPLAIDGPIVSIRRFAVKPLKLEDLIRYGAITSEIGQLLAGCVKAKLNIMISGGTGSGKTTLLNVLSGFIPGKERIVTIEDAAELQLQQEHVVRLETRPPNIEGKGQIAQRDLVINSLRMRPDRIIVGEVRGPEAFDMLQAMNTGHDGSLTTIHANTPRDSLTRLESMILMTGVQLPEKAMRFMISSALDLIVQGTRMPDGSRKIVSVSEVVGMEGDIITLQEIFVFEKKGLGENGKVLGRFRATGIRPKFADRLELAGIHLPENLFSSERYFE